MSHTDETRRLAYAEYMEGRGPHVPEATALNPPRETAVGDLSSDEKGSGARSNSGKVDFSMLPMHLLAGTARVLQFGAMKYAPWNWAKGMAWSVCFACAMRHLIKFWFFREELDEESGEHHLDHAICNLLFMKHYLTAYTDGDDRPPTSVDFISTKKEFNGG